MKNNLLSKALLVFAILCSMLAQATQLSGIYTINPNVAASATNFKDFASAITYMTSTSARADGGTANSGTVGVSGPVIFQVAAATYNVGSAYIDIVAIPGANPTNTITFDGGTGNAATRIITGNIATGTILRFDLCKYVTVQSLTITNTNSSGCGGVVFFNNTTTGSSATTSPAGSCNTLRNCIVNLPNVPLGTTAGGIMTSSTLAAYYYGSGAVFYGDSIIIDGNQVNGSGYAGISMYNSSVANAAYNRGMEITNNTILTPAVYGIMLYGVWNAMKITGNIAKVNPTYSSGYALYFYNCTNSSTTKSHIVANNQFYGPYMGIYCYYPGGTATAPGIFVNNIVVAGTYSSNYGWYAYNNAGCYNNFIHNTVVMLTSGGTYGMYLYETNPIIKNNTFTALAPSNTMTLIYCGLAPSGNVINYNNYWNPGNPTSLIYRGGTFGVTNYLSATAGGDSSTNVAPGFVNMSPAAFNSATADGHLTDGCGPRGAPLSILPAIVQSYIASDIDGLTRSTTSPQLGADEANGLIDDLSLTAVVSPVVPITLGLQDVVVKVKNVGVNVISNFDISYKLNSNSPVVQTYTGTLNPCQEITVTFTGPNQINLGLANNIKIYTSGPNSNPDANRLNDTAGAILYAPLSGNYTIGGVNPNFPTFKDALTALASGIAGPVVFNVAPGTYATQVIVNGPIPGSNPTNTIEFNGGNKATTIISGSYASDCVFKLNNIKYVTVQNFTITNTASGTGVGIIGNTSNNNGGCNTIKNCNINVPQNVTNDYGIMITGNVNGYSVSANFTDSTTIDSNTITGGYMGVYAYGGATSISSTAQYHSIYNRVRYNTLVNPYYYGFYLYYWGGGSQIIKNKILYSASNANAQYSMYLMFYMPTSAGIYKGPKAQNIVSGNIVENPGYAGMYIYMYGPPGAPNNPCLITNNMIRGKGAYASPQYGIYMYGQGQIITSDPTPNLIVAHNTINFNGSAGYALNYVEPVGFVSTFQNNIFSANGAAGAATTFYYTSANANMPTIDYNIYYNAANNGNVVNKNGVNYSQTAAAFYTAAVAGVHSIYVKPPYNSIADPHVNNACYRGTNMLAIVPEDVDGETRASTPNIGADEYPGLERDIMIESVVSPVFPIAVGPQDLRVRIRNNGTSVVSSVNVSYSVNGGASLSYPWVGNLNPCDTLTITLTGAYGVDIAEGNNNYKIWTSGPNAANDQNTSNDTIVTNLSPPMSGTFSIALSGGDFNNFTTAVAAMNSRGVGGPITFNVSNGTYQEPSNVNIGNLIGVSDSSKVIFQSVSGNPAACIMQATVAPLLTIGGSYISFTGIRLNEQTAGTCVKMSGNPKFINFYNCILQSPISTTTAYIVDAQAVPAENVTIKKCILDGAYYTLYPYVTTDVWSAKCKNWQIDSNTFQNSYYFSIYQYYTINFKIRNNTFNCSGSANAGGIYSIYADSSYEFSNNTLNYASNISSAYFYQYYCRGFAASRGRVFNNKCVSVNTGSPSFLVYAYYGNYLDFFNNSFLAPSSSGVAGTWLLGGYYCNYTNFWNNVANVGTGYVYAGNSTYVNIFNNTFTGNGSYVMLDYGANTNMAVKNNVIYNYGSGNSVYWSVAPTAGDNWDYNNLYTLGSTLIAGTATYTTLTNWKTASGKDKNSLSMNPGLMGNNDLRPNPANANSWSLNGRGTPNKLIQVDTVVGYDFFGTNPRSTTLAGGAVDIGAYEFTPTVTPPNATLVPATPPSAGGPQAVLLGLDTIGRITWAGGSVPSSVTVKLYSGTNPPAVSSGGNVMNAYWDITTVPVGSYNYNLDLYHHGNMVGTNPTVANMIGAQRNTTLPSPAWGFVSTATSDVIRNILTLNGLTTFGQFTGTDLNNPFSPLPVMLFDINGKRMVNDVMINWATANEMNSDRFEVERSLDGTNFETIDAVNATRNSSSLINYSYPDKDIASRATGTIYYRLKMVNMDNTNNQYSKVVPVKLDSKLAGATGLEVYPNPFNSAVTVKITLASDATVSMNLMDITGKTLMSDSRDMLAGSTPYHVDGLSNLKPGIYFLQVESNGKTQVQKIVKQ